MARRPRSPLFLARASYRRRRLIDASRLMPLAGGFLFLLPMLWSGTGSPGADRGGDTVRDGLYLFLVWGLLILVAALLAPGLAADPPPDDPDPARGDDG